MALWTPALIDTALWLDAADASTLTLDGSAVSEWRDKSGNARHGSNAGAARPTRVSAGQNGLDLVRFTTAQQLNLVEFAQVSGQSIFFIGDTSAIGIDDRLFMNRSAASANNLALYFGRSGRTYRPDIFWNASATANWPTAVNRKAIYRWSFEVGAPSITRMQIDGGATVTQTLTASQLTNWQSINLASVQQSAFDAYEIIIEQAPDADLIERTFGYLAHKWGLEANLAAGHPYKSVAPQAFAIAGTTRDKAGALAARAVTVLRESNQTVVGTTISDSTTGAFEIYTPHYEPHTLIFTGESDRNAIVYSGVMPS